jgi:hypothetical protein
MEFIFSEAQRCERACVIRWRVDMGEIKPKSGPTFITCVTTFYSTHQESAANYQYMSVNLDWYENDLVSASISAWKRYCRKC